MTIMNLVFSTPVVVFSPPLSQILDVRTTLMGTQWDVK